MPRDKDKTARIATFSLTQKACDDLDTVVAFLGTDNMSVGIRFALHNLAEQIRGRISLLETVEVDPRDSLERSLATFKTDDLTRVSH